MVHETRALDNTTLLSHTIPWWVPYLYIALSIPFTFHGVFDISTLLWVSHSHSMVFLIFVHSFKYPFHIPLCVPYLYIPFQEYSHYNIPWCFQYLYISASIPFSFRGVFNICTFLRVSHSYSIVCSISLHSLEYPIHISWCVPLHIPFSISLIFHEMFHYTFLPVPTSHSHSMV